MSDIDVNIEFNVDESEIEQRFPIYEHYTEYNGIEDFNIEDTLVIYLYQNEKTEDLVDKLHDIALENESKYIMTNIVVFPDEIEENMEQLDKENLHNIIWMIRLGFSDFAIKYSENPEDHSFAGVPFLY